MACRCMQQIIQPESKVKGSLSLINPEPKGKGFISGKLLMTEFP